MHLYISVFEVKITSVAISKPVQIKNNKILKVFLCKTNFKPKLVVIIFFSSFKSSVYLGFVKYTTVYMNYFEMHNLCISQCREMHNDL